MTWVVSDGSAAEQRRHEHDHGHRGEQRAESAAPTRGRRSGTPSWWSDQAGPSTPFVVDTTPRPSACSTTTPIRKANPISVVGIVGCAATRPRRSTCATTGGGSRDDGGERPVHLHAAGRRHDGDSFQYQFVTDAPSAGPPASVTVTVTLTLHGAHLVHRRRRRRARHGHVERSVQHATRPSRPTAASTPMTPTTTSSSTDSTP